MGQALYRKYRSRALSDVIGQEPVTETLKRAIKSGRISHAYLFSGPRGTGKTSVARILAHEVNSLPYKGESFHLDIIEVDAASNRRIDEIRDIREKVHIAPTSGKYKVYIIDEVHMLTKEAFNALLKTLEEPPAHAIFILATTEAHKLPPTIISRTQHFNFKPIDSAKAASHLQDIAKKEKIDIEPAALEFLALHSEGSLRDGISLLDQLSSQSGKITEKKAEEMLGIPPAEQLEKLAMQIKNHGSRAAIDLVTELKASGASASQIASELGRKLRTQMLNEQTPADSRLTNFMKSLLEVSAADQPFELLEVLILEASQLQEVSPKTDNLAPATPSEFKTAEVPYTSAQTAPKKVARQSSKFSLELWPDLLETVKTRATSVYTALRLAKPKLNGAILTLEFQFPLHKAKLSQSQYIGLIGDVIKELSGSEIQIKTVVVPKNQPKILKDEINNLASNPKDSDELAAISNIFGSAEMLE